LKPTKPFKGEGAVPAAFDWRNVADVDYTGEVRDQGACGSCYTFSFIG
jgi:C1A family cysteine protease